MRRIINSDDLRDRFDFKLFRGIPYFLIGLAIARLQGYLYYIPGLQSPCSLLPISTFSEGLTGMKALILKS
jgi:hypothetical protein